MSIYSKHIFPRLLDWTLGSSQIQELRRKALAATAGSVLEIGFGTGLNLPHYPNRVTKLTVIEPEEMLPVKVESRIAASAIPVEQVRLDASRGLPFDDNTFDEVVTTFTLCSIDDLTPALAEMKRVLRIGGRYTFLEHGRSADSRVAKRQDLFNPIQKFIACGCNMNRPIDGLINAAGFEMVNLDRFLLPDTPRVLAEMYCGAARKRSEGESQSGAAS